MRRSDVWRGVRVRLASSRDRESSAAISTGFVRGFGREKPSRQRHAGCAPAPQTSTACKMWFVERSHIDNREALAGEAETDRAFRLQLPIPAPVDAARSRPSGKYTPTARDRAEQKSLVNASATTQAEVFVGLASETQAGLGEKRAPFGSCFWADDGVESVLSDLMQDVGDAWAVADLTVR